VASGQVFGTRTKIQLSLLDLPNLEYALKGIAMELEDGAYPLLTGIEYGSDDKQMFKNCDVVIFLGGAARQPGQERRDLLMVNGKIFQGQGQALNEVAKETCKCLVVANPCNTNCLILSKNCPKIPAKNFTALSRLDHNRAQSQIANKLGCDPNEVKKIIVWGNHSSLQYPDVTHTTLSGKKVEEIINDDNYIKKDFLKLIQHRGAEVLYQRKKSSGFSAAKAIVDHMRDWMFGTESGNWVSMAVISDGSYGVPEGLVFSVPVSCKDFEYEIVKGLEMSDFSNMQIKTGIEELEDERDEASDDVTFM